MRAARTYLINCQSPHNPPFEETECIKKFPNIYYSGQWNEALNLLDADVMFIINSDVHVRSFSRLVCKLKTFYEKFGSKAGVYAPNHYWTPWTYNPSLLEDLGNGLKKVPATDSTVWSLTSNIAYKIGPLDLSVNKLGWGIEIVAAYYSYISDRLVIRDYSVKCDHPRSTAYDRGRADREYRNWVNRLGLGQKYWQYVDTRYKCGFGWHGNDEPAREPVGKILL